jgi:glycolate oxidase
VAENSGGPHTLKYGVTANHVLGLTVVLPDGEIVTLGSDAGGGPGLDLVGVFTGSEGTFGIATEIVVRLTRTPRAVRTFLGIYDSVDAASETVSAIIRAGIVPAAMELIDRLSIRAVEAHMKVGYPEDAEAVLLVELDGTELEVGPLAERVEEICRGSGAREVQVAADEETRARLWKGRKQALGAVGKICRAYYTHDGVVPRSKLPEALRRIYAIGERHGFRIAAICHAGDGNLHPLVLFDPDDPDEAARAKQAGEEILETCLDLGGTITGEHGVGLEKREMIGKLFSEDDLDQMRRVRAVFDPEGRANPDKIFPLGSGCGELRGARPPKTGGWV